MAWQKELNWEALPFPTALPPRLGHTATLVGEKRLYIMGGREGDTFRNDVWTFDCESEEWECVAQHAPFCPRAYASATLVKGRYIWVVGGSNQQDLFSDIHVLDTRTHTWGIPPLHGEPMEIAAHGALLHPVLPDVILIFGGYTRAGDDDNDFTDRLLLLHTTQPHFEQLSPTGPPPPKMGYHTLCALGPRVVSFGGKNKGGRIKDRQLCVYDAAANAWQDVKVKGLAPVARSGHSATVVGVSSILVYGGRSGAQRLADFNLLKMVPPTSTRSCTLQWHPLPGSACGQLELTQTHPGGRAAHTLVARKRSLYVFGGYGGDKLTYAHPYVLRFLPALDSSQDTASPIAHPPAHRVSTRVRRTSFNAAAVGAVAMEEGPKWRSSKRAKLREAVLAATAPAASIVGERQGEGEDGEQTSPHKGKSLRDAGEKWPRVSGRLGAAEAGALAGKNEGAEEKAGPRCWQERAPGENGARRVNEAGRLTRMGGRRRAPLSSGSGQEEESAMCADVTETQSAAERGGRPAGPAGARGGGWHAPRKSCQGEDGGKREGGKREAGPEQVQGQRVASKEEAFAFPCDGRDHSPPGSPLKQRKVVGRGLTEAALQQQGGLPRRRSAVGKVVLPVEPSTGLADFEREQYAAAVARLECDKEALEGRLHDKGTLLACLTAEKHGLGAERDSLAEQLGAVERKWAAAQDEVAQYKQACTAAQHELKEAKRLLSVSEGQRSVAEAQLAAVSGKLEEVGTRLAETALRREALEGTAQRLEEALDKEQLRALEARQSHERERTSLNQVANERAAEKEALRVRLEATAARNDQLQESVSTLTRELADIRTQAKEVRAQGDSHRTALTQANTEKIQLEAAKDAAEKTLASMSAEVGRLRAHSDKVEAEEGRLRTALVQAQGQIEALQGDLKRVQSEGARFKDEADRLRSDVREYQVAAQKVEGEARQLAEHAQQIRTLANRQLRLRPENPSLAHMFENG